MTRGDIVFINNDVEKVTGSEQGYSRPAIIVSNNACNKYSPVVEVVYTTTSHKKRKLPTHVYITSTPKLSTALCEAVFSVDKSRIDKTLGHCSKWEMDAVDHALKISLGLI